MVIAMVGLWVTVLTGVVVLAFWFPTEARAGARPRGALCTVHVSMASFAVIGWTTFAIGRSRFVGTASVIALGVAVIAGTATLVATRRWERAAAEPDATVPVAVLAAHGFVASAAVVVAISAFVVS